MSKKLLGLIGILLVGMIVLSLNTYNSKNNLASNGIKTKGVITKITKNRFDNELSPTVETIHIQYKYIVGDQEYTRTHELPKYEHDQYFSENKKHGDSINIIYDGKKPLNSIIKKLE